MMRERPRQHGYVLLLTLLLLALAATAMSSVSLRSLQRSVLASQAQTDLQRRWGTLSCQATLLPKAESILAHTEEQSTEPVAAHRLDLLLGSQSFQMIFTDEQAKASVNLIYDNCGPDETQRRLRDLLPTLDTATDIHLSPAEGLPKTPGRMVFFSYGQILPGASPGQLIGQEPGAIDQITCFGSGLLNVRRASHAALEAVSLPVLNYGQIEQLLSLRKQYPELPLSSALDQLQLSKENHERAAGRLTDQSHCHGLWIITKSGERSWYHLAVATEMASAGRARVSFSEW